MIHIKNTKLMKKIITVFPVECTEEGFYPLIGTQIQYTKPTTYVDKMTTAKFNSGLKAFHLIAIVSNLEEFNLKSYSGGKATLSNGEIYIPIATTFTDNYMDLDYSTVESFVKRKFSGFLDLRSIIKYNIYRVNNVLLTSDIKTTFSRDEVLILIAKIKEYNYTLDELKNRVNLLEVDNPGLTL